MDSSFLYLFILIMVGVAVLSIYWTYSRSSSMLEEWAAANNLTILSSERRYMRRGPFFWSTSRGQEVFYVRLRDSSGMQRAAYVRVGGWFLGLMSDNVEVRWE
ncbi:MAG: hypothetical protein MUD01_08150 [Chloroflexaceae bacterium]|nr:hypothetical protein [Chloroflexaceae bacterium]